MYLYIFTVLWRCVGYFVLHDEWINVTGELGYLSPLSRAFLISLSLLNVAFFTAVCLPLSFTVVCFTLSLLTIIYTVV